MKKSFLILLILVSLLHSQPEKGKLNQFNTVSFEHHFRTTGGKTELYVSFRIPYSKIIFVKSDDRFKAEFTVTFEAKDTADNFVRESVKGKIIADSYEETTNRLEFYEGLVKLRLKPGHYKIVPEFYSDYTNNFIKLNSFEVNLKKEKNCEVFFVRKDSLNNNFYSNMGNMIPYSSEKYDMIFFTTSEGEKLVELFKGNKKVYSGKVQAKGKRTFNLVLKKEGIMLEQKPGEMFSFEIENFNKKLYEGEYRLKISDEKNGIIYNKRVNVYWLDKPVFLKLGEPAGKLLKLIASDKEVDFILDKDQYFYERLVDFWKDYDPDTSTAFNEVMEEFYRRADYCLEHFSNKAQPNGAFTDRGKILIIYGEPDKVERNYSDRYKIIEIWHYDNLGKEFLFEDNEGLGNYKLVK